MWKLFTGSWKELLLSGGPEDPPARRVVLAAARILYFFVVSFLFERRPFVMASALSYATILGLIPSAVVLAALSKGFIADRMDTFAPQAIEWLVSNLSPVIANLPEQGQGQEIRESLRAYVDGQITPLLVRLDMRPIGFMGVLALILAAFSLMRSVEASFNHLWDVAESRPLHQQFMRYWLTVALFPAGLLFVLWLTGLGVYKEVAALGKSIRVLGIVFDQGGSVCVLVLLFSFAYKLLPNARVRWLPAMAGALVAAVLWQANTLCGFFFVSKALQASYLYGSFGVIPIVLAGVYFAWLVVLFGAHTARAAHHAGHFRSALAISLLRARDVEETAAAAAAAVCARFLAPGAPAVTLAGLAASLGVSDLALEPALRALAARGVILEVPGKPPRYVPARDPAAMRLSDAIAAVSGPDPARAGRPLSTAPAWEAVAAACDRQRRLGSAASDPTLAELARSLIGLGPPAPRA